MSGLKPKAEQNLHEVVFHAGWGAESKAALQEDGKSIWWEPGDNISLFIGDGNNYKLTSTNTEPSATADFVGSTGEIVGSPQYIAVYPYHADTYVCEDRIYVVTPTTQVAQEGSFDSRTFVCVAVSSTENLYFKNVCGGIKFSVANEGIDKITIKANGDDVISGSLALSTSLDVIKGTSWGNSNPSASLVITAPDGGTFHPGSYYYAVIPASEYTNGFTISYHKGNVAASFVDNNDITIKRSTFKRLYNKDADLQFKPVYDAKALFPSNNILPDGVDKTTITEAHFHVNSDKVTDTVISEGTDDYKAVYTQITFYYETQVISHSGNFLSFWCNCLQPGEG